MKSKNKTGKWKKTIRQCILCKDNLGRDIAIVAVTVGLALLLIINNCKSLHGSSLHKNRKSEPKKEIITEQSFTTENEEENIILDTSNWKTYRIKWYGFEIKYPENWNEPVPKKAARGAKWEYRYHFRKPIIDENNPYIGFDVVIYNINKVKELSGTDEFPTVKNKELEALRVCQEIGEYSAGKIYVDENDNCYNAAYFYTLTGNQYIYNIVPVFSGEEESVRSEKNIAKKFPEFISASTFFNLIEIEKPKVVSNPKPAAINAPMPVSYKKDGSGRLVCSNKNDHPSKSDKNKKKHLDMECCLDPDEYPNPHCYYPKDKYGKYL